MKPNLMLGDCLERMSEIEDGSVDAVICDPPYGTVKGLADGDSVEHGMKGKTDWDETLDHARMLEHCNRVLRLNGALLLFCQDPYTGKLMTETHGNLPFSYRLVWLKDHFANSLIAKKAPVKYTEDVCVFFKKYNTLNQHPLRKYAAVVFKFIGKSSREIEAKLEHQGADHFFRVESMQFGPCTEATYNDLISGYGIDKMPGFKIFAELKYIARTFNLLGESYVSNVLQFPKDYDRLHPTQKPVALMAYLLRTYSNEGDTVLDFTMGSGTTGVACEYWDRHFIGIERDPEYFAVAENRIKDAAHRLC